MAVPQHPFLRVSAAWDRPVVPVEGGAAVLIAQIAASRPHNHAEARTPLDIVFVIDRSGSMSGEPLELVKAAVSAALDSLDERDRISLISFDHQVKTWHNLGFASPQQKAMTRMLLQTIRPGGSTNLSGGWFAGCRQLQEFGDGASPRARRVILLTDGQANAGITDPAELSRTATMYRGHGVTTTTIGAGDHFDEMLLSSLAEAGGGNYHYVEHPTQFQAVFQRETRDLAGIVSIAPQLVLTLQPGVTGDLLNAFPARIDGANLIVDLRDLVAGDDLVLVLEVTIPPGPADSVVALLGHLRLQDGSIVPVEIPELPRKPAAEVNSRPQDPEVVRHHVVERTNHARREAIRLDREGDLARSRQVLRESRELLVAAPQSAETAELAAEFDVLAAQEMPFSESMRKRAMHVAHDRSRGRHQR
jgi:Ca-activated chloride channel family protein